MQNRLIVKAGPRASRAIARDGIHPSMVRAVVGASGAAKWLGICGLDQAVFGQWLPSGGSQPIELIGTSIGTFKLAAACQGDPVAGLQGLAHAYIDQAYHGVPTPDDISRETARIVACALPNSGEALLSHPRFRPHIGTVLCKGGLASEREADQKRAMLLAFLANLTGRASLRNRVTRVVFSDARSQWRLCPNDGITSESVQLSEANVVDAAVASGALPVYMRGVSGIAGAPQGVYRDGGLLDYHPVPSLMFSQKPDSGILLYPHFFGTVTPGWFDKFLPWRRASANALSDVLLFAPSAAHLASLPGGRLPDRADFIKMDDEDRQRNWHMALDQSRLLGDEFLELTDCADKLLERIEPLD